MSGYCPDCGNTQCLCKEVECQERTNARIDDSSPAPCWAVPGWTDGYGSVKCVKCGKIQSAGFKACIACCPHNVLDFTEDWHRGGWELEVVCADCGKNFDFTSSDIIANYKAVRYQPNGKEVEDGKEDRSMRDESNLTSLLCCPGHKSRDAIIARLQKRVDELADETDQKRKRIEDLEDRLFAMGAMDEAPCFVCGYSGGGYYHPARHPCAKRHHELVDA